jgi:hypothetical protein
VRVLSVEHEVVASYEEGVCHGRLEWNNLESTVSVLLGNCLQISS